MTARMVLRSVCLSVSMAVLLGAMTGCPVFLGPGSAGSATFKATPANGPAPLVVQFQGHITAAPPYEAESWTWDFGDGTAGDGRNVSHTYTAAGTYTAKLQVVLIAPKFRGEDDYPPVTLEASRPIRVTAVVENLPPIADAGPDQTLFLGPAVALDGSGSSDPDGDPITYAWTFDSRPAGSAAVLAGADTVNPTFTPDLKGVYVLRLIVNDGALDSAPDTMTVTVPNRPPVANAGPDQSVLLDTALSVPLDGSGSSDPDGDPLSYNWSLVSVPAGSFPTLNAANMVTSYLEPDVAGIYVLQLEVHDGTVMSAPDTVQVTVSLRNRPPVADAGPDQNVFLGATVLHDGSGSSDPDGNPLTYAWSIVSAPAGSAAALATPTTVNPTLVPDRKGTYEVQLIVNDGLENSAPDTMLVIVGNRPPVANAGADREADNGELVTLDGSGSSDPDGDPLTYAWSLVSVPTGSAAVLANATSVNPSFTTDLPGNYVAQLIVNDGTVDSAPDTVVISVGNNPPVANAGTDQSLLLGDTATLDGSASFDPEGSPLTYAWTIVSVPAGSTVALSGATTVNPTFLPDLRGSYEIQLVVNDGDLDSLPDTVVVTVGNRPPVANAGPDNEAGNDQIVTLDGSGSSDPDGDPLTYSWSVVSLPPESAAVLANANTVNPSFTTDVGGNYEFQLIVNDGTVDSAPDTVIIDVGQQPPTAIGNVVVGQNLEPEADVYADISDPESAINLDTLYGIPRWTTYLGPPTKQYQDPIQLIRLDPDTAEVLGTVPIYLVVEQEVAPGWTVLRHVVAGQAKGLAVDHATGELWAILGFSLGYEYKQYETYWCLARVNPYTGVAVPVIQPFEQSLPELYAGIAFDDVEGLYGVTGNGGGEKAVDTVHALYGIDRTTELETFLLQFPEPPDVNRTPGEVIAFNTDDGRMYHATGSNEGVSGRIFQSLNLDTLQLLPSTLSSPMETWYRPTAMTYAPGANYFVVADNTDGMNALYRLTPSGSTVAEELIGLTGLYDAVKGLAFLYDRTFAPPLVTLDATGSSDPDLDPLTYQWSFVSVPLGSALTNADLSTPTAITTSFTPDVKGTYVVQIVVNDGTWDSLPATATVHYVNTPPVANAGVDQTYPQGYGEAKLNAGDSYDPDGNELDFEWRFVSVPAGSTLENFSIYPGQDCPAPFFYPDVASDTEPYVLEVTVTDSEGATDTDQVEVLAVIVN